MRISTVAGLLAALAAAASSAEAVSVWSATEPVGDNAKNARVARSAMETVNVDFDAVVAAVAAAEQDGTPVSMSFPLPSGTYDCELSTENSVMPEKLRAKVPTVKALSGMCAGGVSVSVVMETTKSDSLSVTLNLGNGDFVYADNAVANLPSYVVYSYKAVKAAGGPVEFSCGVTENAAQGGARVLGASPEDASAAAESRKLQSTATTGYVFRLALIANREYSAYHGGTLSSALAAVVTMLERVNGVYQNELGVYFELIEDNDKLICHSGNSGCSSLPNDSRLLNLNGNFIRDQGIPTSAYDIGHSVSTASGGVAGYPALCDSGKSRGTTGVNNPEGDPFSVDYVAHELGHQLLGAHSFRDCQGSSDGNFMSEGAVEPGSGITIMGYAGICGDNNLASNSIPHFNSVNLVAMRGLVESRAAQATCGRKISTGRTRPVVSAPSQCEIPKGNSFALTGSVVNGDESSMFYAWDRVDTGYERFLDTNQPRFIPRAPIQSRTRYFPNLYYQTYGVDERFELAPKATTSGDDTMTFRFIARTRYSFGSTTNSQASGLVGDFGVDDTAVRFESSRAPMLWSSSVRGLARVVQGDTMTLTWSVGGSQALSSSVKILLAVNTMVQVSEFNYEADLKELEWQEVAEVPNTGTATVTIPTIAGAANREVNLMIRSSASDECFFFDMVPRLLYTVGGSGPNPSPTPSPVAPTNSPVASVETAFPTPFPTAFPTPFPSSNGPPDSWICSTSWYGTRDGCDCECGALDPDCVDSVNDGLYCGGPSAIVGGNTQTCDIEAGQCVSNLRPEDLPEGFTPVTPPAKKVEGAEQDGGDDETSLVPLIAGVSAGCAALAVVGAAVTVRRRRAAAATGAEEASAGSHDSMAVQSANPMFAQP